METEILNGIETESCLRYLPEVERLPIKALDGKRILSDATDVFKKYISGSLLLRGLNNPGTKTEATFVSGCEICADATFIKMCDDFKRPLADLLLTQDQICEHCLVHPESLSQVDATFFIFLRDGKKPAKGDNVFVACVALIDGGLVVREEKYTDSYIWYGNRKLRIIVHDAA